MPHTEWGAKSPTHQRMSPVRSYPYMEPWEIHCLSRRAWEKQLAIF